MNPIGLFPNTMESASDHVRKATGPMKMEAFAFFVEALNLQGKRQLDLFAQLCGFRVATRIVSEEIEREDEDDVSM